MSPTFKLETPMPQIQMPIFPQGTTHINPNIAFECKEGKVCYWNGHLPVFLHAQEDIRTFRLFTTQLVVNGSATQGEIARAFGIPVRTIKRYGKLYRESGAKGFYAPPKKRSASKLTGDVIEKAQSLLEEGRNLSEIGRELGILSDTLRKAVGSGRLHRSKKRLGFCQYQKRAE